MFVLKNGREVLRAETLLPDLRRDGSTTGSRSRRNSAMRSFPFKGLDGSFDLVGARAIRRNCLSEAFQFFRVGEEDIVLEYLWRFEARSRSLRKPPEKILPGEVIFARAQVEML